MTVQPLQPAATDLDAHRAVLIGHCYRLLGDPHDAEDAVQNTMTKALRALNDFRGDASVETWLYRIATNVCLDELRRRKRRERPMHWPPGEPDDPIEMRPADEWLAPIPDAWLTAASSPDEQLALRESVRLAFVAALQHLPPKQRAALVLMEVAGLSAAETATALETSTASVNSALQRARAKLDELDVKPVAISAEEAELVERYVDAFQDFDLDALAALLTEDVEFSMPPIMLWLRGPERVSEFLATTGSGCEGSVLVPTRANGLPAFAQYRHGGKTPWGLVVLEPRGDRIAGITTFLDAEPLFELFGMPLSVPPS